MNRDIKDQDACGTIISISDVKLNLSKSQLDGCGHCGGANFTHV